MPILNKLVVAGLSVIPRAVVGQVAKRYIAGTTLTEGVRTVRELETKGLMATMDLLGEDITTPGETAEVKEYILGIVQAIKDNRLDSNISLKPTQLGLKIDKELAYRNIRTIVEHAAANANFVRIDMEDASTTDDTLALFRRLRTDGFTNLGVVIQAYLHRSEADVRALVSEGANFRLCKGIYNESPTIAFKQRQEIRDNFLALLRIMLDGGSYAGIATHDDFLIDAAQEMISTMGLPREKSEFQMLLGVREHRRDQLVRDGHRLRIYVPFGEQWYAYSTRRLQENPKMAWYITKAIFTR